MIRDSAKPAQPRPPRISAIRLPELAAGTERDFAARTRVELLEVRDADLSERDLSGVDILEARLINVAMHETQLRGSTIVDTTIERLDAPVLKAADSTFRRVEVAGSRISLAEFPDATWRSVHLVGCKLGYLGLRAAKIHDLLISDCTIEELDIAGATLNRVAFERTRITTLEAHHATLTDVDMREADIQRINGIEGLRGATMSVRQIENLAEVLAAMIGIRSL